MPWRTDTFRRQGFDVLPAFLDRREVSATLRALGAVYPLGDDAALAEVLADDPFAGVRWWPTGTVELDLLPLHPRFLALARTLVGQDDVRLLRSGFWLKVAGAADYDQVLHYDYPNHSLVVPEPDEIVGFFLYLTDVTEELGPTKFVSDEVAGPVDPSCTHVDPAAAPQLYDAEQPALGPAGTVAVYRSTTRHRASSIAAATGHRLTLQFAYGRPSPSVGYTAWPRLGEEPGLVAAVVAASAEQRTALGFPPPGDAYWTSETRHAVAQRYPGIDLD